MEVATSAPQRLETFRDRRVALVRLSQPGDGDRSLGLPRLRSLRGELTRAVADASIKILVLTGADRTFSLGAERAELDEAGGEGLTTLLREGQTLVRQVLELRVLSIAAINGLALGGGLELALACDLRWARPGAVLGFPEAQLGLLPGWGGLPLLWGTAPSLWAEMVASGARIGARRALAAGLVSRILDGRDFESEVIAEAGRLVATSGAVVESIKAIARQLRGPVDLAIADPHIVSLWRARS